MKGFSALQEAFLNHLNAKAVAVTLFLINGVKLQGLIVANDSDCILLRRDGHVQLVYKHAVSTIMPVEALTDFSAPA